MIKEVIRYRWRYYDQARGRFFTTSYHATEQDIRAEHPDATPVDGSRQILYVDSTAKAHSTGDLMRGQPVAPFIPLTKKKPPDEAAVDPDQGQ